MQTKLFVGTRLTPELKMRLSSLIQTDFQCIPFEGKEYVGLYVESVQPTVQELRNASDLFTASLQEHLPDLRADTLPILVFPQVLIG